MTAVNLVTQIYENVGANCNLPLHFRKSPLHTLDKLSKS